MRRTHMERSRRRHRRTWRKQNTKMKPSKQDLQTEQYQGVLKKLRKEEK